MENAVVRHSWKPRLLTEGGRSDGAVKFLPETFSQNR